MKLSTKRQWPFRDLQSFEATHEQMCRAMLNFAICGRGRHHASEALIEGLTDRAAKVGSAISPPLRIAVAKAVLAKLLRDASALQKCQFNLVTLVPEAFALPLSEADQFDPNAFKAWAKSILAGFDYLAVIEPGLYENMGSLAEDGKREAAVSWHAHAVVVTSIGADIEVMLRRRRFGQPGFLPGSEAVHVRSMTYRSLTSRVLYLLKLPRTGYRGFVAKRTSIDQKTGEIQITSLNKFDQKKHMLRPGRRQALFETMVGFTLDQFIFCDGNWDFLFKNLVKQACDEI